MRLRLPDSRMAAYSSPVRISDGNNAPHSAKFRVRFRVLQMQEGGSFPGSETIGSPVHRNRITVMWASLVPGIS